MAHCNAKFFVDDECRSQAWICKQVEWGSDGRSYHKVVIANIDTSETNNNWSLAKSNWQF